MASSKKPTPPDNLRDGFAQARLGKISKSMQPLMTRDATDQELEKIFEDADKYVAGEGEDGPDSKLRSRSGSLLGTMGRLFGRSKNLKH